MNPFRPFDDAAVPRRRIRLVLGKVAGAGTFFGANVVYRDPVNRKDSGIRVRFRGGKTATWTVRIRLVDANDGTKWVRFDTGSLTGLTWHSISVSSIGGSPTATGPGGAPDFQAIGEVELTASNNSYAPGDVANFDSLEWFGGAVNGVEVSGGNLVTKDQGGEFWPTSDAIAFWNASDAVAFWVTSNFLDGIYEFTVTPDADSVPSDLRIELNDDIGVDHTLEYKVGDRFVPFPGTIPVPDTDPITFRLKLAGGTTQGVVDILKAHFDVPDQSEFIEGFVVANTGTVRLPITQTYRQIREVLITVRTDGNNGRSCVVLDKDEDDGPAIEVYNAAGTRVTGLVDAKILGVAG